MEMRNAEWIRILLVDDDEDCRMLVKDAMRQGNILNEVYEVGSAEEALDFLHRRGKHQDAPTVGLMYLDIQMPGMSGQELLKLLRDDKDFQDLPIVMMTNLCDDREKEAAANTGANSYTIKPSDPELFMRTVIQATKYWIGIHQLPNTMVVDTQPLEPAKRN
jgi:CheY-like chemotaxis protein